LRDRGQTTVELALGLPLVVVLLLSVVQVALVMRDQILVTHAAREAARAAALDPDPAAATRAAKAAGPLDPARLEVDLSGRDGRGSHVTASVDYHSPIRLPLLSRAISDVELHGRATMRVER